MRNAWSAAALAWMVFIGIVCLARFDDLPSVEIGFAPTDKLVHGFLHFVLTILLARSLRKQALRGAFSLSVAYGIAIELCQQWFTTFRTADTTDVVANVAGSVIAACLLKLIQKKRQ